MTVSRSIVPFYKNMTLSDLGEPAGNKDEIRGRAAVFEFPLGGGTLPITLVLLHT